MPRKKSVKKSASDFIQKTDEIESFLNSAKEKLSDLHTSWAYEYGILRLYREFESMILDALVGAVNNNTRTIADKTGIKFPTHLTDEVCEYLITGQGYFDFKGRDGLIKIMKYYVPSDHYLVTTIKKEQYKTSLEQLSALRNFVAHKSQVSKTQAKRAIGQERIQDGGAWLKKQNRFEGIISDIKDLANKIQENAPY